MPPVQEMAAARTAIKMAQSLPRSNTLADSALKSAEKSLNGAADAIKIKRYEQARQLAIAAKQKAQQAAKLKQK